MGSSRPETGNSNFLTFFILLALLRGANVEDELLFIVVLFMLLGSQDAAIL